MNVVEELGKDFLDHHGVKGQKWGVRNKSRSSSSDAERHGAAKKKKVSQLSDQELRDLVNRMNMEQQVKRLNPNKISKGRNAAKGVIGVMGAITAVAAFTQSRPGKAIARAFSRSVNFDVSQIGRTELAKVIK